MLRIPYIAINIIRSNNFLLQDQKNCFYHGTVIGFADWTVAVSTCAGLR